MLSSVFTRNPTGKQVKNDLQNTGKMPEKMAGPHDVIRTHNLDTNFLQCSLPRIHQSDLSSDGVVIGRGNFATAVLATYRTPLPLTVAVKSFIPGKTSQKEVLSEAVILNMLKGSGSVPELYGVTSTTSPPGMALVQEYFGQGRTLASLIDSHVELPADVWWSIALQLARGLKNIHDHRVLINDIKEENILVDENHIVKFIDFGLATYNTGRILIIEKVNFDNFSQIAPEVKQGQKTRASSDVYSLGVVIESIMAEGLIHDMWDLVSVCTQDTPELRPSVDVVVDMITSILTEDYRKSF